MAEAVLQKLKNVIIDSSGTFKYILIKVWGQEVGGKEPCKMIVRGYASCPYHSDIFEKVQSCELDPLKLEGEPLGGGRINHRPGDKKLKVYGYSQGYGKADHEVSVGILKKEYPCYDITWSDEG